MVLRRLRGFTGGLDSQLRICLLTATVGKRSYSREPSSLILVEILRSLKEGYLVRKHLFALLVGAVSLTLATPVMAGPNLPDPPDIDLPDPPGPAPAPPRVRTPRPGEAPDFDPLGLFDGDDHRDFGHPGHHKKHKKGKKR